MPRSIAPSEPRAVLFDVGGTLLVDADQDLVGGLRGFLSKAHWPGAQPGDAETLARELLLARGASWDAGRELRLRNWLADRLETSEGDAHVAELALWIESCAWEPAAGAAEVLETLVARGARIAALSNSMWSGTVIAYELGRQGLLAPLRFVLSSADHGVRKPGVPVFRAALERIGVEPEEAWYVGDSWEFDVVGAHAAGMTPVWIGDGPEPDAELPHWRIPDLTALLDLHRSARGAPEGEPA